MLEVSVEMTLTRSGKSICKPGGLRWHSRMPTECLIWKINSVSHLSRASLTLVFTDEGLDLGRRSGVLLDPAPGSAQGRSKAELGGLMDNAVFIGAQISQRVRTERLNA